MQFMFQYPETNGTDTDMLDGGNIDQVATAAEETFYRAPADDVGRDQEAFARLADAGVLGAPNLTPTPKDRIPVRSEASLGGPRFQTCGSAF